MTTSTGRQTHCQRLTSTRFPVNKRNHKLRRGLTLVEIMIALTVTLIVLGAMAQAFKFASGEIAQGRAILEIANRMRNAEQLLRRDLAGITVDVRPHTDQTPDGYFEYIEGVENDSSTTAAGTTDGYLGDVDDFMAFTARSIDGSYRGRLTAAGEPVVESDFAEIVWYSSAPAVDLDGNGVVDFNQSITLLRRVLLILPQRNTVTDTAADGTSVTGFSIVAEADIPGFYRANDISVRAVPLSTAGMFMMVANSVQDLAIRANRYSRVGIFPNQVAVDLLASFRPVDVVSGELSGEDVVLNDIAGFDLRLYSPDAPVQVAGNKALNLNDVGYTDVGTTAVGDYIDIAPLRSGLPSFIPVFDLTSPQFTTGPIGKSGAWGYVTNGLEVPVPASYTVNLAGTYCTWSPTYESDGIDQDGDNVADEGRNGLDDDGINGVDDDGERETAPPYPFPARGIKVTLRVIEKNNRQVRQTSVVHKF